MVATGDRDDFNRQLLTSCRSGSASDSCGWEHGALSDTESTDADGNPPTYRWAILYLRQAGSRKAFAVEAIYSWGKTELC